MTAKTKSKSTRGKGKSPAATAQSVALVSDSAEVIPSVIAYRGYDLHRIADLIDGGRVIQRWEIRDGLAGQAVGIRAGVDGAKFAVDMMLRTAAASANAVEIDWSDL